jgi:sentrin-specific protease 8
MASASVLEYHGTSIYDTDLKTLEEGQWLNDSIMTFAMDFIDNNVVPESSKTALCHPGCVIYSHDIGWIREIGWWP